MKAETEIAELRAENEKLRQQNQWLLEQLTLARRHRFGASSEKIKMTDCEQLFLFNEAEYEADFSHQEPKLDEIKGYRRRKAGQVGIDRMPKDLPVEVIVHELAPEAQVCPECGDALHVMGRDVREELKFIPAKAVIVRHEQCVYACRYCEKTSDHVPIIKAPAHNPVIKGSFASPEAIAHIAYEKFVMGSPLYRQEQNWKRMDIYLNRQTMSNWLIRAANDWLIPVYDRLKMMLWEQGVLHGDETVVQVLREPGKKPQSKSYMWLYRTGCNAEFIIILYEYQSSRQARHPKEFLQEFQGFLHADGYDGYHDLPPQISVVGCWAHVRRRFEEALKVVIPASAQEGSPPMEALRRIAHLYKLEEEFRELPQKDNLKARFAARQTHSKPLVDAFFEWCYKQKHRPKSHFGQAVYYALNQRQYLEKFLLDGRLEIDNNRAERSIKPFVIGRKNWLFCNTPNGAKASAVLYSIVETCKENSINPCDYLSFVFHSAPNLDLNDPASVELLLPWNFKSATSSSA